MPIVENPASQADCHTWRQEEVKGEPGHPVAALLPSVLGLVVLEAEPLEGNLQQPWGCKKEQNVEFHFFQVSVIDCFMISSTKRSAHFLFISSFRPQTISSFMTLFSPCSQCYSIRLTTSECRWWTGDNFVCHFLPQQRRRSFAHINYEFHPSEKLLSAKKFNVSHFLPIF